jgi:hypothetical protein
MSTAREHLVVRETIILWRHGEHRGGPGLGRGTAQCGNRACLVLTKTRDYMGRFRHMQDTSPDETRSEGDPDLG